MQPTTTPTTTTTPTSTTPVGQVDPSALMASIVQQQMGQSGLVSSTPSPIQQNLAAAVTAAQNQGSARDKQITSDYNDAIDQQQVQGQFSLTNGRSAGSGGIMNLAALNDLTGRTESQLKSLEQAKQQALLNNDTQQAATIAGLQTQAYQFQQQANQQVFSNILQIGTYQNQQQTLANQTQQLKDTEKNAINQVALQYGLTVNPGETLDSITSRAAPLASASQKLELEKTKAQINQANASAYKDMHPTAGTPTESATKQAALAGFSSYLTPGGKFDEIQSDGSVMKGKSTIDSNGYVVPTAFKQAIKVAPQHGLSVDDILSNFGSLLAPAYDKKGAIPNSVSPSYGLTPKQLNDYKLVTER